MSTYPVKTGASTLRACLAPPGPNPVVEGRSNLAVEKPVFDGNSGLYAVRLTNGSWPAGDPPARVRRRSFVLRVPRWFRPTKVQVDGERVVRTRRYRACAPR